MHATRPVGQAGSVDDRYEPMNIDVERDKGVTLTYVDGYVVSFDLAMLRKGAHAQNVGGYVIRARTSGHARTALLRCASRTPVCTGRGDWRSHGTTATPQASSRSSSCGDGTKAGDQRNEALTPNNPGPECTSRYPSSPAMRSQGRLGRRGSHGIVGRSGGAFSRRTRRSTLAPSRVAHPATCGTGCNLS